MRQLGQQAAPAQLRHQNQARQWTSQLICQQTLLNKRQSLPKVQAHLRQNQLDLPWLKG